MEQIQALANSIVDFLNGRGNLDVKPFELMCMKKELDETFPEVSFGFDLRRHKFRIICYANIANIWIDISRGKARFLTYEEVNTK